MDGHLDFDDSTSETLYINYLQTCSDWAFIFTDQIKDWLDRYFALRDGLISYSNIYDNIPVFWLEVVKCLKYEESEFVTYRKRVKL